jgi:hypothetical protein
MCFRLLAVSNINSCIESADYAYSYASLTNHDSPYNTSDTRSLNFEGVTNLALAEESAGCEIHLGHVNLSRVRCCETED